MATEVATEQELVERDPRFKAFLRKINLPE